jgi:tetratricopeptide (TPR) repeat protein
LNGSGLNASRLDRLTKLLEQDPSDPFVLYGIAQEHAAAGRTAEAVAFFDRCLAADPAYLYAYYHKARAQQSAGVDEAARATAQAGLSAARAAADSKALSELSAFLDELS